MSWRYPVSLDLAGRKTLVIGAGWNTTAKINELLDAGADVTVLASGASEETRALVAAGRIRWIERDYQPGDVKGFFLAIATNEDRSQNNAPSEEARAAGVLFNAVDDPKNCDFIFPAVVRRGDLQIAITTNGRAPALGVRVKQRIDSEFGPEYAAFAALLGSLRERIIARIPDFGRRRDLWYRMIDSGALERIRAGNLQQATEELNAMIDAEQWSGLEGEALLEAVLKGGDRKVCLTCSFQAEDVAVLDIARRFAPRLPVLFLDTGYHFPETVAYRDKLAAQWNLNLVNLTAAKSVVEQEAELGVLFQIDPSRCCALRKVEPLMTGLEPYDIWITGLRREQSPTRANLQPVELHKLPTGRTIVKISPLAAWKWNEVASYLVVNEIEALPLYEQGYTSIGCAPCTAKPIEGGDARSGRWGGKKLECGIHTFTEKGT